MTVIGLRNCVTTKREWKYLVFYDFDVPLVSDLPKMDLIDMLARNENMSYIYYMTKHGAHFVSFTPFDILMYARRFELFKSLFGGYYSGQTIRMSRKKDETQIPLSYAINYGETIPQLFNIYAKRFNLPPVAFYNTPVKIKRKYQLIYERYETDKK